MATKVEFKRVQTDAEVENIDIKDGQLIYTGTGKTYMDYGNERIPTGSGGGSVDVDTEMSDTSENAVQNKVIKEYVDSQTVPEEVIVSDTQPTGNDWKLWIDSDEVGSQASEITNEYSTSIGLGYSANYVNNNFQSKILSTEITGTTSANGNITTGLSISNYVVLSAYVGNQTDAIPNIYSTNQQWYLHITNSTNANLTNTSVVIKVYYIEI